MRADVDADLEAALARVVTREIPGCTKLVAVERLSGGASQETYRLVVAGADCEQPPCLRRQAGGTGV